jgi:ribose 5-phosphate isomerase B
MTINKHQSVRSALCWNNQIAILARKHNDANVLSLPARFVTGDEVIKIVDIFLDEPFDGGRHLIRTNKIPLPK